MTRMDAAHNSPMDGWRLRRFTKPMFQGSTYRSWGYLFAGLPLGVLWFSLLLPLYLTGAVLIVIWIGLGMLALDQVFARWIGLFERWLAGAALNASIPKPPPVGGHTLMEKGRARLSDEFGYRMLAWSVVRLLTGTLGFVLAILAFVLPIALTLAPISYVWGAPPMEWAWTLWLAPIIGIPAFFGAAHLVRALGRGNARLAEIFLGPFRDRAALEASRRADRAEEKLRIDQELHDSIGHVLTMNVVQAGAGAHVFDQDPEFAREALTNIERRGREALGELDRIIGLVREEEVSREPLPGLADISRLVDEIGEAGMEIQCQIDPVSASPEVGRAAYRIVQEALTNVAKHAPGAATNVRVTLVAGALDIEVVNQPAESQLPVAASGTGSGLRGIHQRVDILGGTSESEPTSGGGFRVHARLPLAVEMSE